MECIKKWSLLIIFILYLALRIFFIWQIPLFEDEALFTGWALEIRNNIGNLTIPLRAGISPLFSWLTSLLMIFFPNQFFAGRILSILAGLLTALITYKITLRIVNKNISLLLLLSYILLPMMFVYNRLALLDSLMVSFILGAIYFSCLYLKNNKKIFLVSYLMSLTLSILVKPISLITVPAILIASFISYKKNHNIFTFVLVSILGILLAMLVIFPYHRQTTSIWSDFILSSDDLSQTVYLIKKNLWLTFHWLNAYYPLSFLITSFLGIILAIVKGKKEEKYYTFIFIIYFLFIIFIDRLYFPRHTLVFAPFLTLLCAIFIANIYKLSHFLALLLILVFLVQNSLAIKTLILSPEKNKVMAKEDTFQFYEDWTSGKILPAVARYFDVEADKKAKIMVWTDGNSLYYYGLPLYLKNKQKIIIKKLPKSKDEMMPLLEKPISQFLVINRGLPYPVDFTDKVEFFLSDRHKVEIVRLK